MKTRLSVAIITLNEERNLAECLASVAFADEIVVVDGGSQDRTCEIARAAGASVIDAPDWLGFGVQKNRAIDACSGDWVLSIDADERVPQVLRDEIQGALANPAFDVYEMPRSSYYCGRFMRHSGWWPDYVRRLFRRGTARFSPAPVHESLQTDANSRAAENPARALEFSHDGAGAAQGQPLFVAVGPDRVAARTPADCNDGGSARRFRVLSHLLPEARVSRRRHGFMLAVSNAEGSYYRYIKAMLLDQQSRD